MLVCNSRGIRYGHWLYWSVFLKIYSFDGLKQRKKLLQDGVTFNHHLDTGWCGTLLCILRIWKEKLYREADNVVDNNPLDLLILTIYLVGEINKTLLILWCVDVHALPGEATFNDFFLWAHIFPHFTANLMKKKTKQKRRSINRGDSLKSVTSE